MHTVDGIEGRQTISTHTFLESWDIGLYELVVYTFPNFAYRACARLSRDYTKNRLLVNWYTWYTGYIACTCFFATYTWLFILVHYLH